jgi:hypothetical protein
MVLALTLADLVNETHREGSGTEFFRLAGDGIADKAKSADVTQVLSGEGVLLGALGDFLFSGLVGADEFLEAGAVPEFGEVPIVVAGLFADFVSGQALSEETGSEVVSFPNLGELPSGHERLLGKPA